MTQDGGGPLWKGRFSKSPAAALMDLSASVRFDRRLWREDIAATGAHARALQRSGLLSGTDAERIAATLASAADDFENDRFGFDPADEDVHSAIERYLTARLGELGARIHAGRSRNDLVVTDLRLWLKTEILSISAMIHELESALVAKADEYRDCVAPGYTHLQRGQPILLAHHLLAHFFALQRDFDRMARSYATVDVSCLGAAAFAGTTLPIDARATAKDLGFARVFDNAADAVGARDFALEFLSAAAILGVNLSRVGEEIVLWTSSEFGFAELDDAYSTGSSIMPQKKNPDVGELVRAKSARITADLLHLLGVMKGLPLAYNRDLQEDKEPVFDAADTLNSVLPALRGAIESMQFHTEALEKTAGSGDTAATDLAEALVSRGVPFRTAHEAVGKLVAFAASKGEPVRNLSGEELAGIHPMLDTGMLTLLDPRTSVNARLSHGGTAPVRVAEQMSRAEELMEAQKDWLAAAGAGARPHGR